MSLLAEGNAFCNPETEVLDKFRSLGRWKGHLYTVFLQCNGMEFTTGFRRSSIQTDKKTYAKFLTNFQKLGEEEPLLLTSKKVFSV